MKEPHKSLEEKILGIEKGKTLSIFMHNSPDPDAMASALVLEKIAGHYGKKSKIYYDEEIDFPTNRLEVKLLNLDFEKISNPESTIGSMDYVALVDVATEGKISHYSLLGPKVIIDIDHHQAEKRSNPGSFIYRGSSGACVSILIDFMKKLKIKFDQKEDRNLIIASYLGLKTDTSGFYEKSMEKIDHAAKKMIDKLLVDDYRRLIYGIEHPEIPIDWSVRLGNVLIELFTAQGDVFHSGVGVTGDTGVVPYITEDLFRRGNFGTVMTYGLCYNIDQDRYSNLKIKASGRSRDKDFDLGGFFSEIFYKDTAQGRMYSGSARKSTQFVTYAGAEILIDNNVDSTEELNDLWDEWKNTISRRINSKLGR